MQDLSEPLHVLELVIGVFDELKIPYVLGGSFASGMYGEMRATRDLDFLCDFRSADLDRFVSLVEPEFFVQKESVKDAVKHGRSFNIIHNETVFKVDIFTRIDNFELQQLERAVIVKPFASDKALRVASVEDILLAKLRWYKLGGEQSAIQWKDLEGIVRVSGAKFDRNYLAQWSQKLGLLQLLDRLLSELKS